MSANPPKGPANAASERLATAETAASAQLEKVIDFAFLEVLSRQRVTIDRARLGGLACS
jgi:hypothetical protein